MGKKKKTLLAAALSGVLVVQPFAATATYATTAEKNNATKVTTEKEVNFGNFSYISQSYDGVTRTSGKSVQSVLGEQLKSLKLSGTVSDNFKKLRQAKDELKKQDAYTFQQTYNQLPIIGAVQKVFVKDTNVQFVTGSAIQSVKEKIQNLNGTWLSTTEAKEKAAVIVDEKYKDKPLMIQRVMYPTEKGLYYAYEVKAVHEVKENAPALFYAYIDGRTGAVLQAYNNVKNAEPATGKGVLGDTKKFNTLKGEDGRFYLVDDSKLDDDYRDDVPGKERNIYVYDFQNTDGEEVELWSDRDNKFNEAYDAAAVDAYYYTQKTHDFFYKTYGRNGYDGKNIPIQVGVHLGYAYSNAFWDGTGVYFGDGDGRDFAPLSGAIDIVAHEITHAVTDSTAQLIYLNESGAINEAMSDIFGTLAEDYVSRVDNKNDFDWDLGEDVYTPSIQGDALRSMSDPTIQGDPDHYGNLLMGSEDNGYVHYNSGIVNKLAYLIAEGGTHYDKEVKGIGKDKMGQMFYRTLTEYLVPSSNMQHLKSSALQAAKDLKFTDVELLYVKNAFDAVGIEDMKNQSTLSLDEETTLTFTKSNETKWLEIKEDEWNTMQDTHITVETVVENGTTNPGTLRYTMFPSKEAVDKGEVYEQYKNVVDKLTFPIAWNGSFYIRVISDEPMTVKIIATTQQNEVTAPPEDICITEETSGAVDGLVQQLKGLRAFRNTILYSTDKGKELADVYYRASKEVVDDYILDANFRKEINRFFTEEAALIEAVANVKEKGSYVVTQRDMKNLLKLKTIFTQKVSKETAKQIDEVWNSLNAASIKGISIQTWLEQQKLVPDGYFEEYAYFVKAKPGTDAKTLEAELTKQFPYELASFTPLKKGTITLQNWYKIKLLTDEDISNNLKGVSGVETIGNAGTATLYTQDVHYHQQWMLDNIGEQITYPSDEESEPAKYGKAGADIRFENYRTLLDGANIDETTVAVIDSGIDFGLGDFEGRIDTEKDYDFTYEDKEADDRVGHGTTVSSIIAANENNGLSIAGVAPKTKILPIKITESPEVYWEYVAYGIRYAADQGVNVILLALGNISVSDTTKQLIDEQLEYAYRKGITIVAAAGNEGIGTLAYPASSPFVIRVGTTNYQDIQNISNAGANLDIVAPGELVPALTVGGETYFYSGTSLSAAYVAGVAATLEGLQPTWTQGKVEEVLKQSVVDLGSKGKDKQYGYGRLDAEKAVKLALNGYVSNDEVALKLLSLGTITDQTTAVTGKVNEFSKVTVKANRKSYTGYSKDNGTFTVTIPKQVVGTKVEVVVEDEFGNGGVQSTKVVTDGTAPMIKTISEISDRSTNVTGTISERSTVTLSNGTKVIAKGNTDSSGKFTLNMSKQNAGTKLTIKVVDTANNIASKSIIVKDKTAPTFQKLNEVSTLSTSISGTVSEASTVEAYVGTKKIGSAKSTSKGSFSIKIAKQKAGTKITIKAIDSTKNTGSKTITVVDKTKPVVQKVNTIHNYSTKVTGTVSESSVVYAYVGTKKIGSVKSGSKGSFSIKIAKQKTGTKITVKAKDTAGNWSSNVYSTVKK